MGVGGGCELGLKKLGVYDQKITFLNDPIQLEVLTRTQEVNSTNWNISNICKTIDSGPENIQHKSEHRCAPHFAVHCVAVCDDT